MRSEKATKTVFRMLMSVFSYSAVRPGRVIRPFERGRPEQVQEAMRSAWSLPRTGRRAPA